VEAVVRTAGQLSGFVVASENPFMCSDPGQDLIIQDMKSGRIDRLVVASCAPSLHETTFRGALERAGLNPYLYEHANIREQVSWVHHGPGATEKAGKLVAAAVAKAAELEPLQAIRVDAKNTPLCWAAACPVSRRPGELVRQGIKVTLVEKSPFLGGNLARLDRLFPYGVKAS
jgi:heterodisulfide reductase subunit A